jgi:hypothetical protein
VGGQGKGDSRGELFSTFAGACCTESNTSLRIFPAHTTDHRHLDRQDLPKRGLYFQ